VRLFPTNEPKIKRMCLQNKQELEKGKKKEEKKEKSTSVVVGAQQLKRFEE